MRDISNRKLQSEGASGELCGTRLAQSVQVVGVPHLGDAEGGMECAELFDPAGVGAFYVETPDFIGGYSGWTSPGSWDGARRNICCKLKTAYVRICSPLFGVLGIFLFCHPQMDDGGRPGTTMRRKERWYWGTGLSTLSCWVPERRDAASTKTYESSSDFRAVGVWAWVEGLVSRH
jgi:hypothetical protein